MWSTLLTLSLTATPPARLAFGGDVIPHDPVKYVARQHERTAAGMDAPAGDLQGWDHVFGPLASVLRRAQVAIVNLETPVTTLRRPERGELTFNAPPGLLRGLAAAGVTTATFANNHVLDQGATGVVETRAHLAEAGVATAGAGATRAEAWAPLRFEVSGVRFALVAGTRWLNGRPNPTAPGAPQAPLVPYPRDPAPGGRSEAQVLAQVRALATEVDAVIVAMHWGEEYQRAPLAEDRRFAVRLAEAGALLIVGHHPHVLQPVEWLERPGRPPALVAFSLGNLVSNQAFGDAAAHERDGLVLTVEVGRGDGDVVEVRGVSGVPTATENRAGPGRRRNVQPVLLEEEFTAVLERLNELYYRRDAASLREQARLDARLELLRARLGRIRALLPGAPPPWSPLAPREETAARVVNAEAPRALGPTLGP